MKLPHPKAQLAGCVWLPRLVAKIRVFLSGKLPVSYRVAFGSRVGVDGYFLRHFRLTMPQVMAAVRRASTDDEVATWFLRRPSVTPHSITDWNAFALKLGAAGQPGHLTLQIVKWFLYPKSRFGAVGSIFEAIAIDECLEEPNHVSATTTAVTPPAPTSALRTQKMSMSKNLSPEAYGALVDKVSKEATTDFRHAAQSEREKRCACCRYFKKGLSAGLSYPELIDFLGVSSPSILELAGYSNAEVQKVMDGLGSISDDEIEQTPV